MSPQGLFHLSHPGYARRLCQLPSAPPVLTELFNEDPLRITTSGRGFPPLAYRWLVPAKFSRLCRRYGLLRC